MWFELSHFKANVSCLFKFSICCAPLQSWNCPPPLIPCVTFCLCLPPLGLPSTASCISSPCWGKCDKYSEHPHPMMAAGHVTLSPYSVHIFQRTWMTQMDLICCGGERVLASLRRSLGPFPPGGRKLCTHCKPQRKPWVFFHSLWCFQWFVM